MFGGLCYRYYTKEFYKNHKQLYFLTIQRKQPSVKGQWMKHYKIYDALATKQEQTKTQIDKKIFPSLKYFLKRK